MFPANQSKTRAHYNQTVYGNRKSKDRNASGLLLGMAAARVLSSALVSLLFGVTSGDPVTFVAMGALLTAVAAVAGYVPAWRASRIDPMVALRSN
jgi:putative ABC transport system permease protein